MVTQKEVGTVEIKKKKKEKEGFHPKKI